MIQSVIEYPLARRPKEVGAISRRMEINLNTFTQLLFMLLFIPYYYYYCHCRRHHHCHYDYLVLI